MKLAVNRQENFSHLEITMGRLVLTVAYSNTGAISGFDLVLFKYGIFFDLFGCLRLGFYRE